MSFIRHSVRLKRIGGHLRTCQPVKNVSRGLSSGKGEGHLEGYVGIQRV